MYTIVMNSDKSLTRTVETTLYQGERLVDKIKFLLPQTYDGLDLSQFEVYLTYIDGGNALRSERLELSDSNYKGSMLYYCVPVGCCLTKFAGNVEVHLTLSKDKKQIMHSGDTNIYITPTDPWYHKIVDVYDCTCGESGDNSGAEGDGSGGEPENGGSVTVVNVQADWNQTDETQSDFIKNKPAIATNEDTMDLMAELGYVTPVASFDGSIYTSANGEIYSL